MKSRNIPGVDFVAIHFTPTESKFKGELCHGFKVILTDRNLFDTIGLGFNLLAALCKVGGDTYKLEPNRGLVGSRDVIERIKKGEPIETIRSSYAKQLDEFIKARNNFIIYKN